MAASNPYEVRCESCRTSFPPETKRCIHCGGPLGASALGWLRAGGTPGAPAPDEDDEEPVAASRARNILWAVTVALAIGMSVLRRCTEG